MILPELSAKRKLSRNRVREVIEAKISSECATRHHELCCQRWNAKANRRPDVIGPSHFSPKPGRLPCGGSDGFGSAEFGNDAELLHEAQSVPVDVAFEHFAVCKAGNAYTGDVELLVCGGNAVEFALMGAAARPTSDYGFAFGEKILDRETNVGEGIAVKSDSLLLSLGTAADIGRGAVVVSVRRCDELVCYLHMALVPNFFEQTTDVSFVLFRHVILLFLNTDFLLACSELA